MTPLDAERAAAWFQNLAIFRIVAGSCGGGMAITQIVLGVVGLLTLGFAGKADVLRAFGTLLPFTVVAAAGAWGAIRWLDRRLASLAQITAPEMCIPLLEFVGNGLPIGRIRPAIEEGLAASLATLDADWWETNARRMKHSVGLALETSRAPERWTRPLDGPWFPALLAAIARCRRVELLPRIEKYEHPNTLRNLPSRIAEAVTRCADELREQKRRAREAATLLRPASSAEETLLRPATGSAPVEAELLLRASAANADPPL